VASILHKVNQVICLDDVLKDILSSLSLIMIDNEIQQVSYSGAGDLPLLHYQSKSAQLKKVGSDGLLLGLFPEGEYTEQHIHLEDNDRLFIFTDGMTDLFAGTGKKSDYNQFMNTLSPLLVHEKSFKQLQQEYFALPAGGRVDDCSIIQIHKQS
jgi:sigma-B regulation protein RsbU (phosphoserine phosphatase)